MSIRQRLNSVEKKSGVGSDVQIIIFRTFYEAKGGGRIEREDYLASVGIPKRSEGYFSISSTVDETWDDFETRVEAECLKAFGKLPPIWHRDMAEVQT